MHGRIAVQRNEGRTLNWRKKRAGGRSPGPVFGMVEGRRKIGSKSGEQSVQTGLLISAVTMPIVSDYQSAVFGRSGWSVVGIG